jgi:hypothetical protein
MLWHQNSSTILRKFNALCFFKQLHVALTNETYSKATDNLTNIVTKAIIMLDSALTDIVTDE